MGRRISDDVKAVKGTLQPCRARSTAPRVKPRLPSPPDFLTPEARLEWQRMARALGPLGILTNLDRGALTAYCMAWGDMVRTARALDALAAEEAVKGYAFKSKRGGLTRNVLRQEHNKARADVVKFGQLFAVTPLARSRINIENLTKAAKVDEVDPVIDKFFN